MPYAAGTMPINLSGSNILAQSTGNTNIFVAASATWNGKALKKAKQDVSVFDKQVKKLGTTLLGVFSARALFNYSKRAVAAFAADEKLIPFLTNLKCKYFHFSSTPHKTDFDEKWGHINIKSEEEWVALFEKCGFKFDRVPT